MRLPEPGGDDTVKLTRPLPRRSHKGTAIAAVVAVLVLIAGGGAAWLFWPTPTREPPPSSAPAQPVPPAAVPPATVTPQAAAPSFNVVTANEEEIRNHVPDSLTVFRFAANPKILVLDFPSLRDQGLMLNRVAALVEKAGLPHDRVLTDPELDAAIRARGDTVETFYYGHDYSAAELARFFELADRDHVELTAQEQTLRALLQQEGWLDSRALGALISLPRVGADPKVTPAARAAILRHELAHGEFFSMLAYAAYTRGFWQSVLTEPERAGIRRFLSDQEYDPSLEELMYNEMQAYLMFTRDRRIFSPSEIGMGEDRLAQLQAAFITGMAPGWLRDAMANPVVVPRRSRRRRSSRQLVRGRVSTGNTAPTTRTLRFRAASTAA
jgi:hypothetical protein